MHAPATKPEAPHRTTATLILDLDAPQCATKEIQHSQDASEYKKHSLAARYWGEIELSKEPIQPVGSAEAEAVFLRGMLERPTERRERNPIDWLISALVHVVIVSAVVIAPLAFTQAIDLRNFQLTYLTVPRPPAAAPPPAPAVTRQVTRQVFRSIQSALMAPSAIPTKIAMVKDPPAPEINEGGVIGGVPGGEIGGVLGGIIGSTGHGPAPPPATPAATKKPAIYRVGGVVKPPRELSIVQPEYPPLARVSHTEGIVVIDAVIDEEGNVVQARAIDGPGLLIAAALKAVMQWKYEPTYLDGTPVAIRMEVQVHFHMR